MSNLISSTNAKLKQCIMLAKAGNLNEIPSIKVKLFSYQC